MNTVLPESFSLILRGHWYPWFELLVTSLLGFKARVGSLIYTLAEAHMMYISWDSQHGCWSLFPTCMFQQRYNTGFVWETSHIAVQRANHSATSDLNQLTEFIDLNAITRANATALGRLSKDCLRIGFP